MHCAPHGLHRGSRLVSQPRLDSLPWNLSSARGRTSCGPPSGHCVSSSSAALSRLGVARDQYVARSHSRQAHRLCRRLLHRNFLSAAVAARAPSRVCSTAAHPGLMRCAGRNMGRHPPRRPHRARGAHLAMCARRHSSSDPPSSGPVLRAMRAPAACLLQAAVTTSAAAAIHARRASRRGARAMRS